MSKPPFVPPKALDTVARIGEVPDLSNSAGTAVLDLTLPWPPISAEALCSAFAPIIDAAYRARQAGEAYANPADILTSFEAYRAYELGWHRHMALADFEAMRAEIDRLERDNAVGPELTWRSRRIDVLEDVLEASPWEFDPDTGSVAPRTA